LRGPVVMPIRPYGSSSLMRRYAASGRHHDAFLLVRERDRLASIQLEDSAEDKVNANVNYRCGTTLNLARGQETGFPVHSVLHPRPVREPLCEFGPEVSG
jgi:hypothetical protein